MAPLVRFQLKVLKRRTTLKTKGKIKKRQQKTCTRNKDRNTPFEVWQYMGGERWRTKRNQKDHLSRHRQMVCEERGISKQCARLKKRMPRMSK